MYFYLVVLENFKGDAEGVYLSAKSVQKKMQFIKNNETEANTTKTNLQLKTGGK